MRINIFRNPFIDVQAGYLLDSLTDARRKETEGYWRKTIVNEILERIESIPNCDVVELIKLSKGKS